MSRVLLPLPLIAIALVAPGCGSGEAPQDETTGAETPAEETPEATPALPPRPVTPEDLDAAKKVVEHGFELVKAGDCEQLPGLMAEPMSAEECKAWVDRVAENQVQLVEIVTVEASAGAADTIEIKTRLRSAKADQQDLTVRAARRGEEWKLLR